MTISKVTLIRLLGSLALLVMLLPVATAFAGVDDDINEFVGNQNRHYWENQPAHFYEYSAPRDTLIQIQDITIPTMRDTWTIFFLAGVGPVDSCFSKGVPIPGSYQLTNPQYMKTDGNGGDAATSVTLDQPEPSGIYTSGDNWQTWVACVLPTGEVSPVVWEGETMVYFSPVHVDETGKIVHDNGPPSAVLNMK